MSLWLNYSPLQWITHSASSIHCMLWNLAILETTPFLNPMVQTSSIHSQPSFPSTCFVKYSTTTILPLGTSSWLSLPFLQPFMNLFISSSFLPIFFLFLVDSRIHPVNYFPANSLPTLDEPYVFSLSAPWWLRTTREKHSGADCYHYTLMVSDLTQAIITTWQPGLQISTKSLLNPFYSSLISNSLILRDICFPFHRKNGIH